MVSPPLALLAELTHRCPLRCPYCSNPLELAREELPTESWSRALGEAATLGVLHVHFSGGEPLVRSDLERLVAAARDNGLYSNLITSGLGLTEARMARLAEAGLNHVQVSLQDSDADAADLIAGRKGSLAAKRAACRQVRAAGLPLTVNIVLHRHNLARLAALTALAEDLGAGRVELAHVQYHGWAASNRAALIPTLSQVHAAADFVAAARQRIAIDHVTPDLYGIRPKACLGGWGARFLLIDPGGRVLPCHAAATIPGLEFERIGERDLAGIWADGLAFQAFRGEGWMKDPCRSCEFREDDHGGCRCQALALAGDARQADPVCERSPIHVALRDAAAAEAARPAPAFRYRGQTDTP